MDAARRGLQRAAADGDRRRVRAKAWTWPDLPPTWNWALDYLDVYARGNARTALLIVAGGQTQTRLSYSELADQSAQLANYWRACGVRAGDRMVLMLPNGPDMFLATVAAVKAGVTLVPCTPLLTEADLADRIRRSNAAHVVAAAPSVDLFERTLAAIARPVQRFFSGEGTPPSGWLPMTVAARAHSAVFVRDWVTHPDSELLLYFTSGTTSAPKMVQHTHRSYPVGHLTTMYWLGLQETDVHWNISSPGWAKHAWSNVYAPLNAGCTIFINNTPGGRFDAVDVLQTLTQFPVTSLCAAPTVWRMLILEPMHAYKTSLRSVCSAGEPLNPEVLRRVQEAWKLTLREGYGQTETTACMGNPPGHTVVPGSLGIPLPGYDMVIDGPNGPVPAAAHSGPADVEGELCLRTHPRRPVGLMTGYLGDDRKTAAVMADGLYRTGDVVRCTPDGVIFYVARADDVFKSAGYRVSPFELENALLEHPGVAETAVVASPDPMRTAVPKAFVTLKGELTLATARDVFRFCRERLPQYARPRRIEFNFPLPKTISGKIRRNELRALEVARFANGFDAATRRPNEWWEDDADVHVSKGKL